MQEEIRNLNSKHSTGSSILFHELDILKKTLKSLEGEKIDLKTELKLIKENCVLLQTKNDDQDELIHNLKDENEKFKQLKEKDLILLDEELQETKSKNNALDQQNLALQSELNFFIEENERWKELDLPTQLLKAGEVIKEQESQIIKLQEELKNTSILWLSKIDSLSRSCYDTVKFDTFLNFIKNFIEIYSI